MACALAVVLFCASHMFSKRFFHSFKFKDCLSPPGTVTFLNNIIVFLHLTFKYDFKEKEQNEVGNGCGRRKCFCLLLVELPMLKVYG